MHERRFAGRTGRAVARPARVARTHAPRVLLAAVALIVLLLQNSVAYALPWQEKDGYPLGNVLMNENVGSNRGTVVYGAANEFFATLCLIGRKSDYLQLSDEQLAKLSNEGTGGAFWELSQRWNNLASDGSPDNWPIGITLAMEGQGLISSPAYIWWADYSFYESDSLYNRALADYLTIYNGGSLGGGGGSSGSTFVLTWVGGINNDTAYGKASTFTFDITLNERLNDVVQRAKDDGYSYVTVFASVYWYYDGSNMPGRAPTLVVSENPPVIGGNKVLSYTGRVVWYRGVYDTVNRDGNKIVGTIGYDYAEAGNNWYVSWTSNDFFVGDGNSGAPVLPPNVWPEPDPTPDPDPDPPDVPEPQEPTGPGIDPPNPIGYTIDPTDNPNPVTDPYVVVVAPDSQDIISWLRAILQAINNLGDKLNDESTELQRALNQVFFTNLSKLLKNIKGEFLQDFTRWLDLELEWMMESFESLFLDLQDYLHDLFEWLADQMNFEFDISTDPYDDTSLLNWLRRIYNKLGSDGGPNTRPVDPSTDPEGFLDWLRRMIAEFILGLGASASDFVSDLGDLLSRLFAKFPFSVPWDLLGILGLLDAAPVAPRANFTIPLTIGNQEFNWTVDINLTGWSTYMESVRTIILVSFISWLAWLTPSVLRDLDPGDFL